MPDELTVYVHGERFMIVRREDVVELEGRAADRFVEEIAPEHAAPSALGVFVTEHAHGGALDDDQAQRDRLRSALASGELVAVRVRGPARVLSEGPVEPLDPREPRNPGIDDPRKPDGPVPLRPHWISVEVVHENGARYPGGSLEVVTPGGTRRTATLDAGSVWRVDDIDGDGHCTFRGSPAFADPRATVSIALVDDDAWLAPTPAATVRLRTERHHRVVVVSGATNIDLFDAASSPVASANCRVEFENRRLDGQTDAQGRFVAQHPAGARICKVSFPAYDKSKIEPSPASP